jgi:starch synthase (maltosyl-transferring)
MQENRKKTPRIPQAEPVLKPDGRVAIISVTPDIECGRYKLKRIAGEEIAVSALIFTDGHEKLAADILFRAQDENDWQRKPLSSTQTDFWTGVFKVERNGSYHFTIEAWRDPFASVIDAMQKKRSAGVDARNEADAANSMIISAQPRQENAPSHAQLVHELKLLEHNYTSSLDLILREETLRLMSRIGPREHICRYDHEIEISVDRPNAQFSSWYELFPRSVTDSADHRHGTFKDVIAHLPYVHELGFDVLYLPPIHPIGKTHRKGRNNSLTAIETDPGSVYAIGSQDGGHDAIHPELGTLDDFRALVAAANHFGLEIALDFAIQCSPDHPWIKAHPEWFSWRPDGTIQYAENPPKKYEDIVNVQFYGNAYPSVWYALRDIIRFWMSQGVRIFRVDNPHTKPLPFWEWLIADIHHADPDVIFLAEAFTRPAMMKQLAKIGFQQSYTYFTWRNTKSELTQYMAELSGPMSDYFRPNFFVNTPDINPFFLQTSGRPGFIIRATLAATLSSSWGLYSGFELCEARPLPGQEEYLDSEKYEIKSWDFDRLGHIKDHIAALNQIRRANPSLQNFRNILMLNAWNDQIIAYFRWNADKTNCILVIVNLDPHHQQDCAYEVPLWEFGFPDTASIDVKDLLHGNSFTLHGKTHQITLEPAHRPAVIWQLIPPAGWGIA